MELSEHDRRELQLLEEGLWRAETRFDRAWMERILAPGFFEFGRSGRIYSREDTLGIAARPIEAKIEDSSVRLLSPDIAQVTYTSVETYEGEEQVANRCSLWSRTEDGWHLLFHQATPVPD
ncbi:MAG: nuclear transport factor 2 family protein [Chloroflexi bacterium]|nr:nuclear transport factor 2 family protein [Chloroflexota bacterium]